MFSGRASLGRTERRTYSTRETPALGQRTGFEGGTKKEGTRKNKGKKKKHYSHPKFDSIIAPALDVIYSCTAYIDVQYSILLPLPPYCFVRVDAHDQY